jgi:SOS-response transcriptional repressor LexA
MRKRHQGNPDPNILTPKQKQVLDIITAHFNRRGMCPTMEQLAAKLKVSKVTAYEHVCVLRLKGLLSQGSKWSRSMRPLDTPAAQLAKLVKLKYAGDVEVAELAERVLAA